MAQAVPSLGKTNFRLVRASEHERQGERHDQFPGIGVCITGQLPALPEEGLGLTAEALVLDAHRQLAVAGDARPGRVVAAEYQRLMVDEAQLFVQGAVANHDPHLPAGVQQSLGAASEKEVNPESAGTSLSRLHINGRLPFGLYLADLGRAPVEGHCSPLFSPVSACRDHKLNQISW